MSTRRIASAFHWASFAYSTAIYGVFALLAVLLFIDLLWRWATGESLILPLE